MIKKIPAGAGILKFLIIDLIHPGEYPNICHQEIRYCLGKYKTEIKSPLFLRALLIHLHKEQ